MLDVAKCKFILFHGELQVEVSLKFATGAVYEKKVKVKHLI